MDLYQSPVQVEIEGVDIHLRVLSKDDETERKRRRREKGAEASEFPNAADLAQSFLEQESLSEKKELEEALAEAQDLTSSLALSDDGSEDEAALGTGQGLTVPAFLTGFLLGILDRVEVRIRNVTFQMDLEIPVEVGATNPEVVTFQLALEDVDVEGITSPAPEAEGSTAAVTNEDKRRILLKNIRAYLITEANVFSTLSRSPSMPSSQASQSPELSTHSVASRDSPSGRHGARRRTAADSDILYQDGFPLQDSEDAFDIPYELGGLAEDDDDDHLEEPASSLSTPRASVYQESPPAVSPQGARSAFAGADPSPWDSEDGDIHSEPALFDIADTGRIPTPPGTDDSFHSSSGSDSSGRVPAEDLTQSHLYSHEDAESMYLSAFSQTESVRLRGMPGGWDNDPPSPEASPLATTGRSSTTTRQDGRALVETASESGSSPAEPPVQKDPISDATGLAQEEEAQVPDIEPEAQDEAATPRGPTRLVKEVLAVQAISVYLPSLHQAVVIPTPAGMRQSVAPNLPGAFSVYSPSMMAATQGQSAVLAAPAPPASKSIDVSLGPLEVRFDMSVGFLFAMVASELLAALQGDAGAATRGAKSASTGPLPELNFSAVKISILFLEKLAGVADTAERILDPKPASFNQEVLLQAVIESLTVGTLPLGSSTETSIELERFRFGYADADVVSFDRRLQMRASVRDVFPTSGADISAKLVQSPDTTKCEVNTLPLHVKLDLQRLDETFSWFGGLSSFLSMGSSMTSNASQAGKSTTKTAPKPRGVRFEAPIRPDDTSATSDNKLDMRIGGFHLDLLGKECSVALDTSAVKLVSRDEGIGVGLSRVRLWGPSLRNSGAEPPILLEVSNTRLEYLKTPKEKDLERLLELITPSKAKFDENDDVIMVDTLLKQRRKGPLLRLNCDAVDIGVHNIAQLRVLPALGEELARLGTVARYLPEDDRPGLLTLALIRKVDLSVDVGGRFGIVQTSLTDFEMTHITIPSLVAVAVNKITATRNQIEELVGSSLVPANAATQVPVLMMRLIGDDIEPVINVKLRGLNIEYRVPTIIDVLGLAADATPQDFEASLAASVANLGEQAHSAITGKLPRGSAVGQKDVSGKPTTVDLSFRECALGLNPLGLASKLNIVLTDARLEFLLPKDENVQAAAHLTRVSLLLIDDVADVSSRDVTFAPGHVQRASGGGVPPTKDLVTQLRARGFVEICQISSANIAVQVTADEDGEKHVDVDVRDDLLVLETCADSTQTLLSLANALKPPTPPSKEVKFKTEVMPVKDLLASISIDAFGKAEGNYNFEDDFAIAEEEGGEDELYYDDSSPFVLPYSEAAAGDEAPEKLFDAASMTSDGTAAQGLNEDVSFGGDALDVRENFFGAPTAVEGGAQRWSSARNTYEAKVDGRTEKCPLKVSVRDVHVIWNLFDGYDWQHTRDVIAKTVQDVEAQAFERRTRGRRRSGFEQDFEEEETVIGDFLFNSIYIGIPANHDPRELTQAINQNIYGDATETESVAATTVTAATSRAGGAHRPKSKRLKLNRSRHHKVTFELKGVNADLLAFPPGSGETQNSVDVRIQDLVIFDHVPTSTWKKFATYDRDAGPRPLESSMVHLEMLNVKPVPDLAATEIVLRVQVLPLRLHVDQDALDFITRFFEFKDDSAPSHASRSDVPFIQRAEVQSIPVQLDFKPKRVDYAGLRSGHTTEFMNFMILDGSRMVLRHTIIYGISGFDRLGKTLNDIWMPDVKRHQLPGVLAGLAPVRSLVNVGSGFKDLIEIPIREYRRDGRIIRSISKGAAAFARSTGTELVKLGAKVATGTQYVLQGAEGMLAQDGEGAAGGGRRDSSGAGGGWDDDEADEGERKQISLYADQPAGFLQGLRSGYSSLARDINLAKGAIVAVPGEVMEARGAAGAAKAVLLRAPTFIFRPAIGATKAISQTLMGATNSMDPENRRRVEEVSFDLELSNVALLLTIVTEIQETLRSQTGLYEDDVLSVLVGQMRVLRVMRSWPSHFLHSTSFLIVMLPPAFGPFCMAPGTSGSRTCIRLRWGGRYLF